VRRKGVKARFGMTVMNVVRGENYVERAMKRVSVIEVKKKV
jgi:hypothetical protein